MYRRTAAFFLMLALAGCVSMSKKPPIQTEPYVDLERFMGPWYVIANIPTFVEKDAYNAVESYELNEDGTIATTFTFNRGGFDGKLKKYTPKGFVRNYETNAEWGMQFIWPFKADYRIVYVNDDYTQTIVGRQKRDYVWIMARTPSISDADYQKLLDLTARQGYDPAEIQKVPQEN